MGEKQKELTPEEIAKRLRKVVVNWEEDKKGKRRKVATVVEGRYQLWTEQGPGRQGVRWALRNYPNSGPGVAGHGRADNLEEAIETCVANWELRQSIAKDGE